MAAVDAADNRSASVADDATEAVELSTLSNGLRVVSESIPGSRTASIGAWVTVGSRDERVERAGASHFLEHLLFKGTPDRPARTVAEQIDAVGGDMNAFTAREHTAFYARVPETAADATIELLFDVLTDPAFRSPDVDAERQVIMEELIAAENTPDDLVFMALYDALFAGHELGREVLGDPRSIGSLGPHEIRAFHDEWYTPANIVVAAAGAVDHQRLVDLARRQLGTVDPGRRPTRLAPPALGPRVVENELPVEQLHVALGWRGLPHDHPDRYALAVANQVLGGAPSSRLFQSIREDRGLAYTVYSTTSAYTGAGSALVYAATSADRGPELLTALRSEVDELVRNGASDREVDVARSGFEGSVLLSLEDSGSRMVRIANGVVLRNRVLSIDDFLARIEAVTVDDVNRVIASVLGGPAVTSLVGPESALTGCRAG